MKKLVSSLFLLLSLIAIMPMNSIAAENWKGHTEVSNLEFGALTGLGIFGTETSWSLLGTAAYQVRPQGLIDDVDERVWAEVEAGPSFFSSALGSGSTGLQYSAHLRWDFTYNEFWTAYGLGGLSGYVLPSSLGSTFTLHPRFGVGVEYQTKTALMFRGEISAELIGLGIALNF